jgi:hypothetical protein
MIDGVRELIVTDTHRVRYEDGTLEVVDRASGKVLWFKATLKSARAITDCVSGQEQAVVDSLIRAGSRLWHPMYKPESVHEKVEDDVDNTRPGVVC